MIDFQALFLIATTGTPRIAQPEALSPIFKDFLQKSLEVDPDRRPSAEALLQHPFFKKTDPLRSLAPYPLSPYLINERLIRSAREQAKAKP